MARQENACWGCGARWASEQAPRTTLRAIAGGRLLPPAAQPAQAWAVPDAGVGSEAVAVAASAVAVRG
jgi:hypothetical protein